MDWNKKKGNLNACKPPPRYHKMFVLLPNTYLEGLVAGFATEADKFGLAQEALDICYKQCAGGITCGEDGLWQLRRGSVPRKSPTRETSYLSLQGLNNKQRRFSFSLVIFIFFFREMRCFYRDWLRSRG